MIYNMEFKISVSFKSQSAITDIFNSKLGVLLFSLSSSLRDPLNDQFLIHIIHISTYCTKQIYTYMYTYKYMYM